MRTSDNVYTIQKDATELLLLHLFTELSVPQFYSFLHEMEKAKMSLEYFS